MKSGMSSFDIAAMVKEIQYLVGGRIDKAYQLSRDRLLLRIRVKDIGKTDLMIVLGKWLYLTSKSHEAPKTPSSFAMLLRKHLTNGTIIGIEQHGFDRIVVFTIQKTEQFQLICEMFREGNIILVSEGKIIQPLIPKSWKQREVRAKRDYIFPPSRYDFNKKDKNRFSEILQNSKKDLVRTLATDVNLGGLYAEEVCLVSQIEKDKKAADLTEKELDSIFEIMERLHSSLLESKGGILVSQDSSLMDIIPFPLKEYKDQEMTELDSMSKAIEKYLQSYVEPEPLDLEFKDIKAKLERQKLQQEKAIANQEKKVERYNTIAELMYANYQACESILKALKEGIENRTISELISKLKEEGNILGYDPAKGEATISLSDESGRSFDAVFNIKKSLEENAGEYYDKVKKSKEKLKGAKESLKDTEKKLANLNLEHIEKKKKRARETKQFWFEKYRWFISSDGNIVIAGRDAKTNDKVVKKYLSDKDRYAHAEIHGAPSVVIKHKDEDITENTLREACQFALAHSKAWNAKIGSGSAYWVESDQVSKTPPAGEFLPRGAFMIRGRRNYFQNINLRLAVGKITYDGAEKLMCASESALENQSQIFIVFEPGDMKKSNFIKKLCDFFDMDQKEIERILPPGDVKVIRTVGVPDGVF